MKVCSIIKDLRTIPGDIDDYKRLSCFHYRGGNCGFTDAIYVVKSGKDETVGVIVYTMPLAGCEMRNVATANLFTDFDAGTRLSLINKNIRCISRVVIEPRYRGIGLASKLVRETMEIVNVPIVEALAVMGIVNPFFEKAGMTAYPTKMSESSVRMKQAFNAVSIDEDEMINAEGVLKKIERLAGSRKRFIKEEIGQFLGPYGRRRYEKFGKNQIEFVMSKLTERPIYYIWINRKLTLRK
jgi:GNAT superfamily N-acetyltransferase